MASRKTLLDMVDKLEPGVRRAFLESVGRIKSDAQIALLTEAIKAGDSPRILRLLNLEASYFEPLDRSLVGAYQKAGDDVMSAWMRDAAAAGAQVRAQFSSRNLRAEEWLGNQSSRLITEIVDDQRDAVRVLLRANTEVGTSPRTTALDIVGRVNRTTGKREGGIVGLHSNDVKSKTRALEELRADPSTKSGRDQMRNYLSRKTRDRRFDGTVKRALKDGKPVPADKARKMLVGMEKKMLRNRGEKIARTELLNSVHSAQEEGLNQLVDDQKVAAKNIVTEWDASEDGATRDSHREADGQTRQKGVPFMVGGYPMLHPGDRSLGAPASEIINCFAPWTQIGLAGLEGSVMSAYSGDLVELVAGDGINLAVTPNHPVLSRRGWIPAGQIVKGDELLYSIDADVRASPAEPDVSNRYASAEQLHEALKRSGSVGRASRAIVDLHGHAPSHDVEVVSIPRKLRNALNSTISQVFGDFAFTSADISKGARSLYSGLLLTLGCATAHPDCSMSAFHASTSLLLREKAGGPPIPLADAGPVDPEVGKARIDRAATDANFLGNAKNGVTAFDHILDERKDGQPFLTAPLDPDFRGAQLFRRVFVEGVSRGHYSGPVYDFQSSNGMLLASGVIVHNCRCYRRTRIDWMQQLADDEARAA